MLEKRILSGEIRELARFLDGKRIKQPVVLVLGAEVGEVFHPYDNIDNLGAFRKRGMGHLTSDFPTEQDRLDALFQEVTAVHHTLKDTDGPETYTYLAQLIKDKYVRILITTHHDTFLEQALIEAGLQESKDFNVLTPRQERDISRMYEQYDSGCWLVKAFGSTHDMSSSYSISLRPVMKTFLRECLAEDILVVGLDYERDAGLLSAFPERGKQCWLVNEEPFDEESPIVDILKGRTTIRSITGDEGNPEIFLKYLTHNLNEIRSVEEPGATPLAIVEPDNPLHTHHADVLLVTVTDVEAEAVLVLFPYSKLHHIGKHSYHDLGIVSGARTFMVQSSMGSGGTGGSGFTVSESIQAVSPSAVIMAGIAFGVNAKKQKIGDILVSEQIMKYDLRRIGTDKEGHMRVIPRGDRATASVSLLSRFRASKLKNAFQGWENPPDVDFGLFLSGSSLVDNEEYKNQLLYLEPEAIGGDMEGAGLYDAATYHKVDWILVKAICDWADGKKRFKKAERQKQAADNAARFVIAVMQQGGFAISKP